MNIHHHLSEELLLEYASGSLSEGWGIAVATHLALCPGCRRRLDVMEQAGGMLIKDMRCDDAGADGAWEKMKARLAEAKPEPAVPREPPPRTGSSGTGAVLPEPLRSYAGGDVQSLKWRALGRGAYHIPIATPDASTSVRLLRIPAGKPVPEHSHGGRELTLVLSGSFDDGDECFARGDIEETDETLTHQPIATKGEDCICLAVTDAPLKFRSWLVRLVQPVLGI